jgi:hypothetical protein
MLMSSLLKLWIPVGLVSLLLLVGCSDPGPAEQLGEEIDEAVQEAQDAIDPPGPAERAGRAVDDAVEDAGEAIDDATNNSD